MMMFYKVCPCLLIVFGILTTLMVAQISSEEPKPFESGKSILIVVAKMSVKPDRIDDFLLQTREIVEETRKEPGCLTYQLLQDTIDRGSFMFYEEYADQAAFDYHGKQPYLASFRKIRESMLDGRVELKIFEAVRK
ncbi:MAG: putative quinol monooxygenase [Thermoguttaceae bacterium]